MNVSPKCLHPLFDAKGNTILDGMVLELCPGTRSYRRLHKVRLHRAGFVMFVRDDGGYTRSASSTDNDFGFSPTSPPEG
jgi:hypothetical protein